MYDNGLWVFGYGSLLWRPGFAFDSRQRARLSGFRRAFCMHSIHYRGTPESPGLVLALDPHPGTDCEGVAFRIAPEHAAQTLAYLRDRELISSAYYEDFCDVRLECGTVVRALCYIVDRDHAQYAQLSLTDQAEVIARALGPAGPNWEYLFNTVEHLAELGIADPEMEALGRMVAARRNGIRVSPDQ